MATGPEHYTEAEKCLAKADDYPYGDERESTAFRGAQVHATLALAAAKALSEGGMMPGADFDAWAAVCASAPKQPVESTPLWWLDDGHENPGPPELYTSDEAAREAAEKQYCNANPLAAGVSMQWQLTEDVETDDDGAPVGAFYDMELIGAGWRTGIFVRPVWPKDAA
jgi:hypothetical protein